MASASPTALLPISDRLVSERSEAKAYDGSDGKFAGLMAQFTPPATKPAGTLVGSSPQARSEALRSRRSDSSQTAHVDASSTTAAQDSPNRPAPVREQSAQVPTPRDPSRNNPAAASTPAPRNGATAAPDASGTPATPAKADASPTTNAQPQGAQGQPPVAPTVDDTAAAVAQALALTQAQFQASQGSSLIPIAAQAPNATLDPNAAPDPSATLDPKAALDPMAMLKVGLAASQGLPLPQAPSAPAATAALPTPTQIQPQTPTPAPAQTPVPLPTSAASLSQDLAKALQSQSPSPAANDPGSAAPTQGQPTSPIITFQAAVAATGAPSKETPKPAAAAQLATGLLAEAALASAKTPLLLAAPAAPQALTPVQLKLQLEAAPLSAEATKATAAEAGFPTPTLDLGAQKVQGTSTQALHLPDGSSAAVLNAPAKTMEVAPAPVVTEAATIQTPLTAPVSQVAGSMRWMLKTGSQEAQLQLHPDSLGQVTIHLKVEGGEVHARIWVTDPSSAQAVQEGRAHLELSLKEQGLQLGSFDLQQGNHPSQQAPPTAAYSTPPAADLLQARQEAPPGPLPSVLNPHHVELYA